MVALNKVHPRPTSVGGAFPRTTAGNKNNGGAPLTPLLASPRPTAHVFLHRPLSRSLHPILEIASCAATFMKICNTMCYLLLVKDTCEEKMKMKIPPQQLSQHHPAPTRHHLLPSHCECPSLPSFWRDRYQPGVPKQTFSIRKERVKGNGTSRCITVQEF